MHLTPQWLPAVVLHTLIISQVAAADDWLLMTSHKEPEQTDGLHLAVSPDGLDWTVINEDRSVLTPTLPEVFRDPSIGRDPDGTYHLVWTIAWGAGRYKGIGYCRSTDLVHWSEQRMIPVMENEPNTEFVWAPELFWDADRSEWMIHWSSSVTGRFPETLALFNGRNNPRIYYTYTRSFESFTPSRLLFNPDCLAIDSHLSAVPSNDYCVFFKADRAEEPKRGILVARAPSPAGPYTVDPHMITAPDEGWAEGPCAVRFGDTTRLYYAMQGYSSAYASTDLHAWTSLRAKIYSTRRLPPRHHHPHPRRNAQRLMTHRYEPPVEWEDPKIDRRHTIGWRFRDSCGMFC